MSLKQQIAQDLNRHVKTLSLTLLGNPTSKNSNQWRYGKKGSLLINVSGTNEGRWKCFETDQHGDALDLITFVMGLTDDALIGFALNFVEPHKSLTIKRSQKNRTGKQVAKKRWSKTAQEIWDETVPLLNTIGWEYIVDKRKVQLPTSGHIRFHKRIYYEKGLFLPALVSLLTDFLTNKRTSLHFTFLDYQSRDKTYLIPSKKYLKGHESRGTVVRLWPDEEVTCGLFLSEGIENGLAAAKAGRRPVWAATSSGNLGNLPVLEGISSLTILADNDKPGIKAAQKLGIRYRDAGREVTIMYPENPGEDWNDHVKGFY